MLRIWKKLFHSVLVVLVLMALIVSHQIARADACDGQSGDTLLDCLDRESDNLEDQFQQQVKANTINEAQANNLQKQLNGIQSQILLAQEKTRKLSDSIKQRERDIGSRYTYFKERVREYYKFSLGGSAFWRFVYELVSAQSSNDFLLNLMYGEQTTNEDKDYIVSVTTDIMKLDEDKKQVESDTARLAVLQKKLDTQKKFFDVEIAKSKKYQAELRDKIAILSAKQQAILGARSGSFITSVGSVPIGSDYDASIAGFNDGAPSGAFGVFSFGAYTHRNGMSQYGAKKLAESKNYREIIKWYYGKDIKKDDGMPDTIDVSGHGNMDFQTYLYGIAEMPSDWPLEALKAQAIAARTYAMRAGKPICTSESCQVFLKSKSENPPASWRQAVDETRKEVIDGDVSSQYSSTAGGYLNTSGWDTTDRSGGGDWTSRALESQAGSPWFYKAWYRNGYKNSDNSCGRKPWLSEEEMSDIINAWLVLKKGEGNGIDTGRVLPVTIGSCSIGGQGGDPYSMTELRSKTNNPVTSISGKPTVSNNGSGSTTNVRFMTNRGEVNIPGLEFKEVFNTRAPGYISIPQKGFAFFNVERK